jgi:RHS repeat-associated protein
VGGTTTTFAYRGDGLRDSRTTGGNTTTFTWDIGGGLPVVLDDGSQYVYGLGLVSQVSGANTYYYLPDGLGSTMAMVDGGGTVVKTYGYDVYGKVTSSSGSVANEFDFAGQQTDPTGLQYLRARYYDTGTGSFLSRDPLSSGPGWSGHPFGYAGAAPANFSDPSGLDKCSWKDPWECAKNAGTAVGGAVGGTASAATDYLQDATDALVDFAVGKAKDPLVQLTIAQAAAGFAAALACPAAVASGGAAAPACAGAIALFGYTIWAKQEIIKRRREEGIYNEAQFICMLITSAPFPIPGVIPGISAPLCPAVGKLQGVVEDALGGSDETPSPLKEKP